MTYHRVCNKSNTTGVIYGAETAHPSEEPEFPSGFSGIRVVQCLVCLLCSGVYIIVCPFPYGHYILFPSSLYSLPFFIIFSSLLQLYIFCIVYFLYADIPIWDCFELIN